MTYCSVKRRFSLVCCFAALAGCSQEATAPKQVADGGGARPEVTSQKPSTVKAEGSLFEFAAPVQLASDEGPVRVESPGYAAPCWADVDEDGKKDLLVGQFNSGKIRVFKHLGDLKFASGQWLEAGGEVAQVPGVW